MKVTGRKRQQAGRTPYASPIIKAMLEDRDIFIRRCRDGYEFFKTLRQRKMTQTINNSAVDARTAPP